MSHIITRYQKKTYEEAWENLKEELRDWQEESQEEGNTEEAEAYAWIITHMERVEELKIKGGK